MPSFIRCRKSLIHPSRFFPTSSQSREHAFKAKAMSSLASLKREQARIELETGHHMLVGLSLAGTLRQLIRYWKNSIHWQKETCIAFKSETGPHMHLSGLIYLGRHTLSAHQVCKERHSKWSATGCSTAVQAHNALHRLVKAYMNNCTLKTHRLNHHKHVAALKKTFAMTDRRFW